LIEKVEDKENGKCFMMQKQHPLYKGKYRNGKQIGRFQYFLPDGKCTYRKLPFKGKAILKPNIFHAKWETNFVVGRKYLK
jgi:hypothetical protein